MSSRQSSTSCDAGRRDGGQAAVEVALALPVVVLLVLGFLQVVAVARSQLGVEAAARAGARAASVALDPIAAARSAASSSTSLHPLTVETTLDPTTVRVTVRYEDPTNVPMIGPFVGPVTVSATAVMMREPPDLGAGGAAEIGRRLRSTAPAIQPTIEQNRAMGADHGIAVIFTNQLTGDDPEGYLETAERMERLAAEQPGYRGIETARSADGFGVTVSYWSSHDDALAWKSQVEHAAAQRAGRERWYAWYRVRIATVDREYSYDRGHDAPE